jgi:hypothetical protein
MNNDEIRYKILLVLYNKFYSGQARRHIVTDNAINEAGLLNTDTRIYPNIDYLKTVT